MRTELRPRNSSQLRTLKEIVTLCNYKDCVVSIHWHTNIHLCWHNKWELSWAHDKLRVPQLKYICILCTFSQSNLFTWHTFPSTVSWKHLPTCPFCLIFVLWWFCPWFWPVLCTLFCPLPFPLVLIWLLPGWERCCTEWPVSAVWPGLTRATWWIWTWASGGCWTCTFTSEGKMEAIKTEKHCNYIAVINV